MSQASFCKDFYYYSKRSKIILLKIVSNTCILLNMWPGLLNLNVVLYNTEAERLQMCSELHDTTTCEWNCHFIRSFWITTTVTFHNARTHFTNIRQMLLVMSFRTLHNLNFRYMVWWQTYVKIQIDLYQRLSVLKDKYILCLILDYRRWVPKHAGD